MELCLCPALNGIIHFNWWHRNRCATCSSDGLGRITPFLLCCNRNGMRCDRGILQEISHTTTTSTWTSFAWRTPRETTTAQTKGNFHCNWSICGWLHHLHQQHHAKSHHASSQIYAAWHPLAPARMPASQQNLGFGCGSMSDLHIFHRALNWCFGDANGLLRVVVGFFVQSHS